MSGLTESEDHPKSDMSHNTIDRAKLTGGCPQASEADQMIAHFSASHVANDAYRRRLANRDLDNGSRVEAIPKVFRKPFAMGQ